LKKQLGFVSVLVATLPFVLTGPVQAAGPTCFGVPATIVGTALADTILLTPARDVVVAGPGDDRVGIERRHADDSLAAEDATGDLICGGPGNDYLDGFGVAEKIHGGDGDDTIFGAHTVIFGGGGDDHVWGAPLIYGGDGDDYLADDAACRPSEIHGGPGNDTIEAGSAVGPSASDPYPLWEDCPRGTDNDLAYGDGGNDQVAGGDNNDRLYGGPGRDDFYGGFGADACWGGPGRDRFYDCETKHQN
jgi:Ca2+-binding RTX toxin-like protein